MATGKARPAAQPLTRYAANALGMRIEKKSIRPMKKLLRSKFTILS